MNLPELTEFNRVIIIDDNQEEGESIKEALASQHVPSLFIHFDDKQKLPPKPFPNARLVFLDLDMLASVGGDHPKAVHALTALSQVVGEQSFYLLIIWSTYTNSPLEKAFLEVINSDRFSCLRPIVPPISLSKHECKIKKGFSPHKINRLIKQRLGGVSNYTLLTQWEATINQAISQFASGIFFDNDQQSMSQKLHALAKAYAGSNYEKDTAKYALLTLNGALKGAIDDGVMARNHSSNNRRIDKNPKALPEKDKAIVNQALMLNPDRCPGPGCVYGGAGDLSKELLGRIGSDGCIKIKVDVTPLCDNAQQKNKFIYFIHGLLVPGGVKIKKTSETPDYVYMGLRNPFVYEGRIVKLVLDLRTLETISKTGGVRSPKKSGPLFRLRDSLVTDIQYRIAGHNARPGHTLL